LPIDEFAIGERPLAGVAGGKLLSLSRQRK